jgi:hypothetical protein
VIVTTEHGRYLFEGEGPVYMTVLEYDDPRRLAGAAGIGERVKLTSPIRLGLGLHLVWDGFTREQIQDPLMGSNRIVSIEP